GQERVPSWSLNRPEEGIHGQGGSHSVPLWLPAAAAARGQGDALAADEGGPPEGARDTIGSGAEPCAAEDEEELEEEMALAAAAAAAAAGLPGLLREEEMERAYEIFCGGEELTFQRFLTGIGVLG
ncbi:unnamed protein product, partial [Ectocarpus sp. 8 AP-2014]